MIACSRSHEPTILTTTEAKAMSWWSLAMESMKPLPSLRPKQRLCVDDRLRQVAWTQYPQCDRSKGCEWMIACNGDHEAAALTAAKTTAVYGWSLAAESMKLLPSLRPKQRLWVDDHRQGGTWSRVCFAAYDFPNDSDSQKNLPLRSRFREALQTNVGRQIILHRLSQFQNHSLCQERIHFNEDEELSINPAWHNLISFERSKGTIQKKL